MNTADRVSIPHRPPGPLLCTGRIWSELDGWSGCELTDEAGSVYHKVQRARPTYDERWYTVEVEQCPIFPSAKCAETATATPALSTSSAQHAGSGCSKRDWLPELAAKAVNLPVIERRRKGRGYRCLCAVDAGTLAALQEQARRHRVPAVRQACKQAVERMSNNG